MKIITRITYLLGIVSFTFTHYTNAQGVDQLHPILGGYESCDDLKQQLEMEDSGLIREDMANFDWKYGDLVKALKHCNLPIVPEIYVK